MNKKIDIRRRASKIRGWIRNSAPVRIIKAAPECVSWYLDREIFPKNFLVVDLSIRTGMGALIAYAIRVAYWASQNKIEIKIISNSPIYSQKEDVFAKYFIREKFEFDRCAISSLSREWLLSHVIQRHVPYHNAVSLFRKLFTPNNILQTEIDRILNGCDFDLSIHYRATDKFVESGQTSHEKMLEELNFDLRSARRVFLATDDECFASLLIDKWSNIEFVSYNLGKVDGGVARHFSNISPGDKALEALVNMFMIAHAPRCIRTMSYLSSFIRIINPKISTRTVNRIPHYQAPFPENELLRAEESDDAL